MQRIMTIAHKGGEYVSINISAMTDNISEVWTTLEQATEYLAKPSATKNVAVQILDTQMGKTEYAKFLDWLSDVAANIYRLAIVGATRRDMRQLTKGIKALSQQPNYRFIYDWDSAKDWLVGGR